MQSYWKNLRGYQLGFNTASPRQVTGNGDKCAKTVSRILKKKKKKKRSEIDMIEIEITGQIIGTKSKLPRLVCFRRIWFIWDVFQHDYHVCWLICRYKPSKPSRSVTKNVLAVDGDRQPKKWRKVRGHDKPMHGNCAFYFPGGITVVDLNWLVGSRT